MQHHTTLIKSLLLRCIVCRERESHHLHTLFPFTCMPHIRIPMTVRIAAFCLHAAYTHTHDCTHRCFFLLDARACTGLADRLHVFSLSSWRESLEKVREIILVVSSQHCLRSLRYVETCLCGPTWFYSGFHLPQPKYTCNCWQSVGGMCVCVWNEASSWPRAPWQAEAAISHALR